ncbi:hypothetical protein PybrP1_011296 [[Pythium] brassicae (nom. inval.)]|nr:hypothetical protein PybrP1_011296 [[Pythium] brassicae (nom. inval.)]
MHPLSPVELLPPAPPALSVRVSLAFEPESEAATTPSTCASPPSASSSPSTLLRKKRALSASPTASPINNNTSDGGEQVSPTNQEPEPVPATDAGATSGDHGIDPHDLMLLKVIGRGTFAQQVALAKHTRTQSMYVVKTLDKRNLVRRKQVAHTLAEKSDMAPGARTYSFCGSPEYLSPEMVAKDGHGFETDMWSFGCFCYELLTGAPPFQQGSSLARLFEQIRRGAVWYPSDLSGPALSLLEGLLCVDPSRRLTAVQAMAHPFFQTLDWADLLQRHVAPPIVPVCDGCDCTQNFDDGFTSEPVVSLKLGDGPQLHDAAHSSSSADPQQKRLRPDASACGFDAPDPLAAFQDF